MRRRSITEARQGLSDLVNEVAYGHERVELVRRGKPVAAVISIDDLAMLERVEDELDIAAADAALSDPANAERIPWESVRGEL